MKQLGLMWSAEDSLVSPSASPADGSHNSTSDGCGPSSLASSERSSQGSSSSRTCQGCGLPVCETCWPTLPISGSMRSGRVSQREKIRDARTDGRTPELLTSDDGSFLLPPTPTASRYGANRGGSAGRVGKERASLETLARRGLLPTPVASLSVNGPTKHGDGSPTLLGAVGAKMPSGLLPTPLARDWRGPTAAGRQGGPGLCNALEAKRPSAKRPSALLPTPTVKGNHNRAGLTERSGDGLATAVGGTLHPRFVEWMMGFPMDWTVPSEMTEADVKQKRASLRRKLPTPGE